jgi:neutral ceramidase
MRLRCSLLLIAVLSVAPLHAADTPWRAGVSKTVITPETPLWMAGYASRNHVAEGKQTELHAKALVIEDGEQHRAVLVTLDLIGVERALGLELRQKIADKLKLGLAQVMICCSHTHSGPVVAKNLLPMHYLVLDAEQRKLVDAYARSLEEKVLATVDDANANLAPAELAHASGSCAFAVNRRNNKEAEVLELRAKNEPFKGPSDHDVPVLRVKNKSGEIVAVVFGYACHATVLDGYFWSGDYPAYAQAAVEKEHPGAVALFWAGCGGDQNPLPRRKVELAQQYGNTLAKSVEAVLTGDMQTLPAKLVAQYTEVDLPLAKLPTRDELTAQAQDKNVYVGIRAKHGLAELDAGRALPQSYPYPIAVWRIGELEWFFLGGEVVVDYALRLKAERRAQDTWVAAYSNDVMAYIPSRRVLSEGGYEGGGAMVYYGLPTIWAETVESDLMSGIEKLDNAKKGR